MVYAWLWNHGTTNELSEPPYLRFMVCRFDPEAVDHRDLAWPWVVERRPIPVWRGLRPFRVLTWDSLFGMGNQWTDAAIPAECLAVSLA